MSKQFLSLYYQQRGAIDVVITDVMMPVMDGLELLTTLRQMDPDLRVIGASGLMHGDKLADLSAANVSAVISKPFMAGKLLNTLTDVLQN